MISLRYTLLLLIQLPLLAMQAPQPHYRPTYLQLLPKEIRSTVARALVYQSYHDQSKMGWFKNVFKNLTGSKNDHDEKIAVIETLKSYLQAHDALLDPRYGHLLDNPNEIGALTVALCNSFDSRLSEILDHFTTPATPEWLIKNGLILTPDSYPELEPELKEECNKVWKHFVAMLENAVKLKNTDLLKRLVLIEDQFGKTALYWSVLRGETKAVSWLLEHGASIEQRPKDSIYSLLGWAASEGNIDIVKILLDHGAHPDICNKDFSMLYRLSTSFLLKPAQIAIVKLLLAKGANPKVNLEHAKFIHKLRIKQEQHVDETELVRQEIIKLLEYACRNT